MKILTTLEFDQLFLEQTEKHKQQIRARIRNIELFGHFGTYRIVDDSVVELKWENGRRIYYAYRGKTAVLLLLGGNKNGQTKDISNAKKICAEYQ